MNRSLLTGDRYIAQSDKNVQTEKTIIRASSLFNVGKLILTITHEQGNRAAAEGVESSFVEVLGGKPPINMMHLQRIYSLKSDEKQIFANTITDIIKINCI